MGTEGRVQHGGHGEHRDHGERAALRIGSDREGVHHGNPESAKEFSRNFFKRKLVQLDASRCKLVQLGSLRVEGAWLRF